MANAVVIFVTVSVGLAACVTDIRFRRIPNVLTFGAAAAGLVWHAVVHGGPGLIMAGEGLIVGLALFLPFFVLGGMGGGDVKLLAALGAWLGPRDALMLALFASLAGGVMAVFVGITHGYLRTALRNTWTIVVSWFLMGPRPVPSMTLADSKSPRLAFALPMFVGTMVVVWLR